MPAPKIVDVQARDAQIATLHVSIKSLQVGTRQMTQSIFKQLPRLCLIDDDTYLPKGEVWGWVKYDLQEKWKRNYVFQVNERLYRCEFMPLTWNEMYAPECQHYVGDLPGNLWQAVDWLYANRTEHSDKYQAWDILMNHLKSMDQLFIAA